MTGFARHEGRAGEAGFVWEIRSVNGKGLDLRLRTPPGFDSLEQKVRALAPKNLSRGNLQATLTLERDRSEALPRLNLDMLDAVSAAAHQVHERTGAALPDAAQLMNFRGVLEMKEPEADDRDAVEDALVAGFEVALSALVGARQTEGEALAQILNEQLDLIAQLVERAEADSSRTPQAIRARLKVQLDRLGEDLGKIDADRLAQEAALIATKADVSEELDRLNAHIRTTRDLLTKDEPVGRKLEFLAQEFNREANTLCSKSNAVSLTEIGLELKVVIDRLREQALNVE